MTEAEQKIERQRVEWVFGLTGGELADEPWVYGTGEYERFRYWFEGPPDYADADFRDRYDAGVEYRTAVCVGVIVHDPGDGWKLVKTFTSSGESECPGRNDTSGETVMVDQREVPGPSRMELVGGHKVGAVTEDECPLCEAKKGEAHGFIYLGDGWVEAVYRKQGEETP